MANWYVLYTKPKWEKKTALQLNEKGIICYCPLVSKLEQWSDRKKRVEKPLFNSYVFVQIADKDRNLVFQSAGAVRFLFWLGKPAIVKDEEITTIKTWLELGNEIEITTDAHKIGDTIQLDTGPFANQKAVVQDVKNTHYVLFLASLGCVLKMKK